MNRTPERILKAAFQFQDTEKPSVKTPSIWQQYGAAIVDQYPPEEWRRRLLQVPERYRDYVKSILVLRHGYKVEENE